jgi:hypothetical protein
MSLGSGRSSESSPVWDSIHRPEKAKPLLTSSSTWSVGFEVEEDFGDSLPVEGVLISNPQSSSDLTDGQSLTGQCPNAL